MLKKRGKNRFCCALAWMLVLITTFSFTVGAQTIPEDDTWRDKIQPKLWDVMAEKSEEELIPVYLWLKGIEEETVTQALIEEKQMDPAVYENEEEFQKQIVSEIEDQLVARVGYEKAHAVVLPEESAAAEAGIVSSVEKLEALSEEDPDAFLDQSISLVDRAVGGKAKEYMMAKREITKREQSSANEAFLKAYVEDENREILYNGEYTGTLILEATAAEIEYYAKQEEVEGISLYEDLEAQPDSTIAIRQIGADSLTGTQSGRYNDGTGLKGTGVTIGIIETGGRYDSNAPQLEGRPSGRLQFLGSTSEKIDDHATRITSLIVGKPYTDKYDVIYEGVVPNATVIQMCIGSPAGLYRAIHSLVDRGVKIINYSAGFKEMHNYSEVDQEVDRLIYSTGVIFVTSAGNTSGEVTSPGKALNAITVGNADTKNDYLQTRIEPFSIYTSSSYTEPGCLPNKPDLVAPGTNIVVHLKANADPIARTGNSYSAPLVTGVLAQMCQRDPSLTYSCERAKAMLLLGAEPGKISATNNDYVAHFQRDRSGAGLVNAQKAIAALENGFSEGGPIYSDSYSAGSHSFQAGQKIRAVMVFGKRNTKQIASSSDMEDIDLCLIKDKTGITVARSNSPRNNVEIIEYTITESGQYHFQFVPCRVLDTTHYVPMSLAWQIVN